jgi:hypothetical protein
MSRLRLNPIGTALAGFVLGASIFTVSTALASGNTGSMSLKAGSSLGVSCANALTNSNVHSNSETVNCASKVVTTTTTTVPPTTTTTTPPTTTTTDPPTTTTTDPPTTTTTQPSGSGGSWACSQSNTSSGECEYNQTDPNISGPLVQNWEENGPDEWNAISGANITTNFNTPENWQAVANMPAGNTAVVAYPDTWVHLAYPFVTVDSGNSLVQTFSESMPHNAGTVAWAMDDLWLNNWGNEVMIQYDFTNNGACDSGTEVADNVTFGGSNGVPAQQWHLCDFGGTLDWKLGASEATRQSESSGSIDVLAMVKWLETNGYLPAGSTWTALSNGWEICSTGGVPETFSYNNFSLTSS